jgi:hypothetical protein
VSNAGSGVRRLGGAGIGRPRIEEAFMPQYMLLIYGPQGGGPQTPEELAAQHDAWMRVTQEMIDAGVHVDGNALEAIDTATTVRVRGGETIVSDGPFADTKELLGGYYILDVPDLDSALSWAARLPNVTFGSVEVRPVMVLADMPTAS